MTTAQQMLITSDTIEDLCAVAWHMKDEMRYVDNGMYFYFDDCSVLHISKDNTAETYRGAENIGPVKTGERKFS